MGLVVNGLLDGFIFVLFGILMVFVMIRCWWVKGLWIFVMLMLLVCLLVVILVVSLVDGDLVMLCVFSVGDLM